MEKILIVEDGIIIGRALTKKVESSGFVYEWAKSKKEVAQILEKENDIFAAILDLSLPDAPQGEIVDFVLEKGIPSVVFTSTFDDDIIDTMNAKNIIDYIIKSGDENINYAVWLLDRLRKNKNIKVLVFFIKKFNLHWV